MLAISVTGVLAIAGCGDEGEATTEASDTGGQSDFSLELDPETAEPGDLLAARVVNRSEEPFTYGAGYQLERETDGVFKRVDQPDRAVIQIAYVVEPGETGPPVRVKVPAEAEAGRWRVVLPQEAPDGSELASEFEVVGDG